MFRKHSSLQLEMCLALLGAEAKAAAAAAAVAAAVAALPARGGICLQIVIKPSILANAY